MTRAQLLLVFVGVGVVAIVAGVITAFVIAGRAHDDTTRHLRAAADATATSFVERHGIKTSTPLQLGTPIPIESLHPITLMFCEPLREPGGTRMAIVESTGVEVVYAPGGCDPDVDGSGGVLVRNGDGSTRRASLTYVAPNRMAVGENVVWTPAKGTLNGTDVVMTGRYLQHDATVEFDSLGAPQVTFRMTQDGQQVFGSLSRRLIGYPIATFVDGEPLRGEHGQILAPTIQAEITEEGLFTGLTLDGATRIAALINNGLAQ